jgi:hypothetical protein
LDFASIARFCPLPTRLARTNRPPLAQQRLLREQQCSQPSAYAQSSPPPSVLLSPNECNSALRNPATQRPDFMRKVRTNDQSDELFH